MPEIVQVEGMAVAVKLIPLTFAPLMLTARAAGATVKPGLLAVTE